MNQYKNGIISDFALGEDGWNDEMNANLKRIDTQLEAGVNGFVAALPGSPVAGDSYVNTTDNTINVFFAGSWLTMPLITGRLYLNKSDNRYYTFDGSAMALFTGLPAIETTSGAADAAKLVKTNASGHIGPNFLAGFPVFANAAAFEAFYGRVGADGDRFLNSTLGDIFYYSTSKGGWVTLGTFADLSISNNLNVGNDLTVGNNLTVTETATMKSLVVTSDIGHSVTSGLANALKAKQTRQVGQTVGIGGTAIAPSSINFFTTSTAPAGVLVSNQTVTITTTGNPVEFTLVGAAGNNAAYLKAEGNGTDGYGKLLLFRDGATLVSGTTFGQSDDDSVSNVDYIVPCGTFNAYDEVPAGTYTYTLRAYVLIGSKVECQNLRLKAKEEF